MTSLGHVLRGGSPTAYDRVIATRFGVEAIDAVNDGEFGVMVALRGTDVIRVPIQDGVEQLKTVDRKLFDTAAVFFGYRCWSARCGPDTRPRTLACPASRCVAVVDACARR